MRQYILDKEIINQYLYREVLIKPLDDLKGRLLAICMNKYGFEYQVRYYLNGEQKTEWFLEQEITLIGK